MDALVFSAAAWMFYDEHKKGVTTAVGADLEWDSPAQEEAADADVMAWEVQGLLEDWEAIDNPCKLAHSLEQATLLEQSMDALFKTGPKHWQAMMDVVATKHSECLSFIRHAYCKAWPQLVEIHSRTPQVSTPVNNPTTNATGRPSTSSNPLPRKECPDCKKQVADLRDHKKYCKKAVFTRTIDVFMYFLAILLGISRSNDFADLLVFLNTFVPQGHPLSYKAIETFLAALYATHLLVTPHLYDDMAKKLAKTDVGDVLRQKLRDWVYRDPLGVFFTNTHCAIAFQYEVRPRVVERVPVSLCPEFLNPSGKSRE
jgi:hypothetical protein